MGGECLECVGAAEALDFVDGTLHADRREWVEDHIDGCDACRRLVAAIIQSGTGPRQPDPSEPGALPPGTAVGRYVVERLVGRGGMGVVYEAHDPELDRRVALKLLSPGAQAEEPSREAHGRLLREARALARLSHPNVVSVYDVGELREDVYIAMELVGGTTLRRWLAGDHARHEILAVLLAAGRGLAAAHASGLVHRDVKPDNIIVGDDGRARLVDFGLVRAAGERTEIGGAADVTGDSLTRSGETVGTPAYMAPEQRRGGAIDPRADQFAFCVTACQALTGEYPLDRAGAPPGVRPGAARALPARLRRPLLRGMAARPADRFESMDALLAALSGERRRRRFVWTGAALGAAILAGSIGLALRGAPASAVCTGADRNFDRVWDPATRQATFGAFESSGHPGGGAAFARVEHAMNKFRRDWTTTHTAVCRDTRVHRSRSEKILEVRMRCLEANLAQARALIEKLQSIDAATVDRALPAVLSLPTGASCAALERSGPHDDTAGVIANLVRSRAARADALVSLGRFEDGVREATMAEQMARETGEVGARRRALLSLGKAQSKAGRYAEAERSLRELIRLASGAADDRSVAEAWIELVPVLTELGRFAEAVAIEGAVDAAITRVGGDAALRARAVRYQSEAGAWQLDYERAVPQADESVALAIEAYGDAHPFVAEARANLAQLLSEVDAYDRAHEVIEQAIALNTELFGTAHPITAFTVAIKGRIAHLRGDYTQARELLDHAVAQISSGSSQHPVLSYIYREQGWLELDQGHSAAAREKFELALARTRADFGPNDFRAAIYLTDLAEAYVAEGRLDDAAAALTESLPIRATSRGAGHVSVGRGLERLGRVEFLRRNFVSALSLFERAMPIYLALGAVERIRITEALIAGTSWELGHDRATNLAKVRAAAAELRELGSGEVDVVDAWLADKPR